VEVFIGTVPLIDLLCYCGSLHRERGIQRERGIHWRGIQREVSKRGIQIEVSKREVSR